MKNSIWEEFENFLGSTFHQDIDSPEEALEEYINDEEKDWIKTLAEKIESFLESSVSDEEKNNFIKENTNLYFPAMGMTPLQWIEHILMRLKEVEG